MSIYSSLVPRLIRNKCSVHIDDSDLVHRGNPYWPEHDDRGFRNRRIPAKADIVVIGDSQTYGAGVARDATWPALLGVRIGRSVYNAGMGGWGFMQYGLIADELLSLRPNQIVVAIYTGNDLYEAFFSTRASRSPLAQSWWEPQYASLPWVDLSRRHMKTRRLTELTADGRLNRAEALTVCARDSLANCNRVALGGVGYFLEDEYRFKNQDLAEPVIQAGFEIAHRVMKHLRNVADCFGINLTAVLIPTREYIVYRRLKDVETIGDVESLRRLGANESQVLERLLSVCQDLYIPCLDLSTVLAKAIEHGIYPQDSDDGHFSSAGCRIIASSLDPFVRRFRPQRSEIYPLY